MTKLWKSIHQFEDKFDRGAEHFTLCHPYLALVTMFIGMPIFILLAVAVSVTVLAFPMACLFGWI